MTDVEAGVEAAGQAQCERSSRVGVGVFMARGSRVPCFVSQSARPSQEDPQRPHAPESPVQRAPFSTIQHPLQQPCKGSWGMDFDPADVVCLTPQRRETPDVRVWLVSCGSVCRLPHIARTPQPPGMSGPVDAPRQGSFPRAPGVVQIQGECASEPFTGAKGEEDVARASTAATSSSSGGSLHILNPADRHAVATLVFVCTVHGEAPP